MPRLHLFFADPSRGGLSALLVVCSLLVTASPGSAQIQDPNAPPIPGGTTATIARVPIDSVEVVGNILIGTGAIRGTIGINAGDTISGRNIRDAERRLWSTGRLSDLEVTARPGRNPEAAILTFRIEEHPILRRRSIEGLESLDPDDVWDEIELELNEYYSPQLAVDAREYIQTELAEKGIPYVQVEEQLILDPDTPGDASLILQVTEGQRVILADVLFNGNDIIEDSELVGALATRPEGFWWYRSGAFQVDDLELDLAVTLPALYAARGFLDFTVLGDTLIVDPNTGKARLEIDVSEGPRYRVADLSIEGNRRFVTQRLEQYFQPGDSGLLARIGIGGGDDDDEFPVFDQAAFDEATARIGDLYFNEGYLGANIAPTLERLPPETEGADPRVAVGWSIEEGLPSYINRVFIVGNDHTYDRVIRERIQVLPGDVFSRDRVLASMQSISGLGFFEAPLPLPQIVPTPDGSGDVDVTFEVVEQQTGIVEFGTTVAGVTGLSGFVGYREPNLFGQGKSGAIRWDFGQYQNSFTLSYTDPALFQSRISGSMSLFNSRDRFFSFSTGERKVLGASTRIGLPVPGSLLTRLYLGYSISRTDYDLEGGADDTSLFGRDSGLQSQFSVGLSRNTLDHPSFPTVGSQQSWTVEFNGGILGGDGDFTKHVLEGTWWVPVGQLGSGSATSSPIRLALGFRARAGAIFGNAETFPFERFWVGGVQFGEPLRGYEETTITPSGYFDRGSGQIQEAQRNGDAFMTLGAEYAIRLNPNISVSTFYEAGNVWRASREVNPSDLYRGAGFALDLVTPFAPIGLDLAYGFDLNEPGWQVHFRYGGQLGF